MASAFRSINIAVNNAQRELRNLLKDSPKDEQAFHNFFERRPFALPLSFSLGHVQFGSIITKLPIDTSLITDFCYITRHTAKTAVVLVELETPAKKFFTNEIRYLRQSKDFSQALAQIQTWKDYVRSNREALLQRLYPALPTIALATPIEFKFVLIYGRESEFVAHPRSLRRYEGLSSDEVRVMTYDSVLRHLENNQGLHFWNVLRLAGQAYTYKFMHTLPGPNFAQVGRDNFFLSKKHQTALKKHGYEIDRWLAGARLSINGKHEYLRGSLHAIQESAWEGFEDYQIKVAKNPMVAFEGRTKLPSKA